MHSFFEIRCLELPPPGCRQPRLLSLEWNFSSPYPGSTSCNILFLFIVIMQEYEERETQWK